MEISIREDYLTGKNLERTLGEFRDYLTDHTLDIEEDEIMYGKLRVLKERLERAEEESIPKEELERIYSKYHKDALDSLGKSLRLFHMVRHSEASRTLDLSVLFTKLLKVPDFDYVRTVLKNTPVPYIRRELEDQLESKHLTNTELQTLLDEFIVSLTKPSVSGIEEYKMATRDLRLLKERRLKRLTSENPQ